MTSFLLFSLKIIINYASPDIEKAKSDKKELEAKGCFCILVNMKSNIQV